MDIFNQFVSAFIGVLITILPTSGAQNSSSADSAATSSVTTTQASALIQLRDTLVSLQSRFESTGGHFARTEDDSTHATSSRTDDEGDEDEDRGTSTTATARATESGRGISSSRGETSRHSEDEQESEDEEGEDEDDRDEHRSTVTAPATPKTPVPTTSTQQPAATPAYTSAQVAAHSTAASCYSIVNGSVYDLTRWISQHPGGSGAIKSMCGVDASAAFNGQHGGSARPASELTGFKIGTLAR